MEEKVEWQYYPLNSINFENYFDKTIIGINIIYLKKADKQSEILIIDDGFILMNLQLNQNMNNSNLWDYQSDLNNLKVAVVILDNNIKAKGYADFLRQKYRPKYNGRTYVNGNLGMTPSNLPEIYLAL